MIPLVDYASDSSEEPAAPVPPAVVATPAPAPETAPHRPKPKHHPKPPPRPKVRRDRAREGSRISSQRSVRPRSAVPRHRAHHRTRPRPRPRPHPHPTPHLHLRHLHLDLHWMTMKVVLHLHLDLHRMTTTVAHHHRTASSPRKMHRRHRKLCLYHHALET